MACVALGSTPESMVMAMMVEPVGDLRKMREDLCEEHAAWVKMRQAQWDKATGKTP
jgi:hypothetical protein